MVGEDEGDRVLGEYRWEAVFRVTAHDEADAVGVEQIGCGSQLHKANVADGILHPPASTHAL